MVSCRCVPSCGSFPCAHISHMRPQSISLSWGTSARTLQTHMLSGSAGGRAQSCHRCGVGLAAATTDGKSKRHQPRHQNTRISRTKLVHRGADVPLGRLLRSPGWLAGVRFESPTCNSSRKAMAPRDGAQKVDTLGIEPRASRMLSGCDTTTPCAQLMKPELMIVATDHKVLDVDQAKVRTVSAHEI